MQAPEPQPQHQWLKKLVGDWTMTSEASMGPDQPPIESEGTETFRAIGDLWVQGEGRGSMPDGGTAIMTMTLGYDPNKKRFVGSWFGSMMAYLWVYEGELNEAGTTLTLNTVGPSMSGDGTMGQYQDIIEFLNDDHRTLKAQALGPDGKWNHFMTTHYRRK